MKKKHWVSLVNSSFETTRTTHPQCRAPIGCNNLLLKGIDPFHRRPPLPPSRYPSIRPLTDVASSSPLYSHIPPPLSTALTETRIKRILRTRISNSNMCVSRIIGLTQSLDIWVTRRGRRCCCCWRVASAFWWNGRTVVSGRERRWNMILYWIICFFSVWASIKCASRVSKKSILLSNIKKIWVFQIHQNVFISNVWCQYIRVFSQFLWAFCDA